MSAFRKAAGALALLMVSAAHGKPYEAMDTYQSLDKAQTEKLLVGMRARGGIDALTVIEQGLGLQVERGNMVGPDEDEVYSGRAVTSDRSLTVDFQLIDLPMPCGLRHDVPHSAYFWRHNGHWRADSPLAWFIMTGRCAP